MGFGIFLFYLHYIVAVILLYHILICVYEKSRLNRYESYIISDQDKRHKLPLWGIILLIVTLFIPVVNLIAFGVYLGTVVNEFKDPPCYIKSVFTKKF
jgi:ABC-type Fe3+ transport system permease subunit